MAWFEKDFITFFKELELNNNKEWFNDNKKRYEKIVKAPFQDFIAVMISRIQKDDPSVAIPPKDAIFRIFRDVRFSADKRPYKVHMSAVISSAGRKNLSIPGSYIEFSHKKVQYYGGAHHLENDQLERVRHAIIKNNNAFNSIISDKTFVASFGEVLGEKNKRLSKEFMEAAEKQPLLFNKNYYFGAQLKTDLLLKDNLADELFKLYLAGKSFNQFFLKAIN